MYEVGRQFRNEGIDLTHNPEFTSCEFYQVQHTVCHADVPEHHRACKADTHVQWAASLAEVKWG